VLVSTVKQDEPGNGYLRPTTDDERVNEANRETLGHLGLVEGFVGDHDVFDRIKRREGTFKTKELLTAPHLF
jgi:hypothetical protein